MGHAAWCVHGHVTISHCAVRETLSFSCSRITVRQHRHVTRPSRRRVRGIAHLAPRSATTRQHQHLGRHAAPTATHGHGHQSIHVENQYCSRRGAITARVRTHMKCSQSDITGPDRTRGSRPGAWHAGQVHAYALLGSSPAVDGLMEGRRPPRARGLSAARHTRRRAPSESARARDAAAAVRPRRAAEAGRPTSAQIARAQPRLCVARCGRRRA